MIEALSANLAAVDALKSVATEELNPESIPAIDALNSFKSAIAFAELAEIDCSIEELNPANPNTALYVEALNAVTLALLALNDVATDELKSPVTLAILAALALNEVATELLNVLMFELKSGVILPSAPNKNKVLLLLA